MTYSLLTLYLKKIPMKKLALLAFVVISIVACKEKDLTNDNPALPEENLQLKTSFLYGDKGIYEDSVLVNNKGNRFFITDIKFLLNNLYFIHTNKPERDSVLWDTGYYAISTDALTKFVAILEPGGYSGHYGFKIGLDSVAWANRPTNPRGDALTDADLIRNDGFGYNALVIKGRAIDPADPLDTAGNIPFEYNIGGYFISKKYRSDKLNFSLSSSSEVNLILNVDIEPIFNDFDIVAKPTVISDISDPVDYEIAEMMMDSLAVGLF